MKTTTENRVHEMRVVLRHAKSPEFRDVYWSPTYCSTVTDAILAYLDHLQSSGNIAPSSIRALIHFHAGMLIGNLEANSAPGRQQQPRLDAIGPHVLK